MANFILERRTRNDYLRKIMESVVTVLTSDDESGQRILQALVLARTALAVDARRESEDDIP